MVQYLSNCEVKGEETYITKKVDYSLREHVSFEFLCIRDCLENQFSKNVYIKIKINIE